MNKFWIRAFGVFGMLGGLTLFAGDMLFYYDPVNTNFLENMSNSSDNRIILSAVTALFATWFYMLGVGQIYYAFKPSSKVMRNIVVISFSAIFITYGVVHGAYVAIATSARIAAENNLNLEETASLAKQANNVLRLFGYPIFAIMSYAFISEVWKKKTLYSRWIIFFFPLVPFLFKDLINSMVSGPMDVIIRGGFLNLILVLFFLASTVDLWKTKDRGSR